MSTTYKRQPRVVPTSPLTVAIEDAGGLCLGYGVVANVSRGGACVWTNGSFPPGAKLSFRLSFCQPAEVCEVDGVVIWEGAGEGPRGAAIRQFGVQWRATTPLCEERIHAMVRETEDDMLTPRSLAALRRTHVEH